MWVLDCYGRINLRSQPYQNEFGMAWCPEERHCNPPVENFTSGNWIVGNIIKMLVNYKFLIKFYDINKNINNLN
jgi:hypothetical protein